MSAFFAAAYADRVEILTDGAVYDDDGVVVDIQTKVWRSASLPLAFAGRGNHRSVSMIGAVLDLASWRGTVDHALATFAEKLEGRSDKGTEQVAIDGVIAAISETGGPVLKYFHTYQGDGEDFCEVEPFRLYAVDTELCAGSHPEPRDFRNSGLPMYWACDGLAEHGATFFSLLRRHPIRHLAHPDRPMLHAIGGHVDHTVVRAEGVVTNRIHEWPDVVGRKINSVAAASAEAA